MRSSITTQTTDPDNLQPWLTLNRLETISLLKRANRTPIMTKDTTQPLSDLSSGQDVSFPSPTDQTSYLEGTTGQAHTPRSYYIEAQGRRYRHNRQHMCPINTNTSPPFSSPSTHTTPEWDNNSNTSGPSHISGPPLPPKQLEVIWSSKIPQPTPYPDTPSHKPCNMSHHQCPYTRPPLTKPSNAHSSPISGPLPPAELCLDKLLALLVSLNGTL